NLSLATLKGLGGAATIVRKHFDGVMKTLADAERDVAAHTLRFLITRSGTKIAHTAADLAEFAHESGIAHVSESEVESLLAKLSGQTRILRKVEPAPGQHASRFEIFHDVLADGILAWVAQYRQAKEKEEATKKAAETAKKAADEAEHERRLREAAEEAREAERKRAEEADARKRDAEGAGRRQKQLSSRFLIAAI